MDNEMESQLIPTKRARLSIEESAMADQKLLQVESRHKKRLLCNELVYELCRTIPAMGASDQILLTAFNVRTYLVPRFRKKLIYRDVIASLKAMLDKVGNNKTLHISIHQVYYQCKESEDIVVIKQTQTKDEFLMETNQFRIRLTYGLFHYDHLSKVACFIPDFLLEVERIQIYYFLRLIAPLIPPIRLNLYTSVNRPVTGLVRFLNAHSGFIESIKLRDEQFNLAPIYEALRKHNKLYIYGRSCPVNVPNLIHWLTANNCGKPNECILFWAIKLETNPFLDEVKMDFARATRKSKFVVHLKVRKQTTEFTLCNETTGEKLELRHTHTNDARFFYTLSRHPVAEVPNYVNEWLDVDPCQMTKLYLR